MKQTMQGILLKPNLIQNNMRKLIPTQLYLPKNLRKEIDKARSINGESLSSYIRKAAEERVRNKQ